MAVFATFGGFTPPVGLKVGVVGANSCIFLMGGGTPTILSRKKNGSTFFGFLGADLVRNSLLKLRPCINTEKNTEKFTKNLQKIYMKIYRKKTEKFISSEQFYLIILS